MIYIVSGGRRSGTTMMMSALISGGIEGCYSSTNDHNRDLGLKKVHGDSYNPGSFFEGGARLWDGEYEENKVTKVFTDSLVTIGKLHKTKKFKCIVMIREPKECVKSYHRIFNMDINISSYIHEINVVIPSLNRFDNMDIIPLDYHITANNPESSADILIENNIPINKNKFVDDIKSRSTIRLK